MNVPNLLTGLRIFLVPLLVAILLTAEAPGREIWGLIIFILAALTDILDGYLARKHKQVTTAGVLLDPIADKLLISSALISLVELGSAPAWMVVVIIGREFAVTGLRSAAAAKGIAVSAMKLGKLKMVTQAVAVAFLIWGRLVTDFYIPEIGWLLLWLATILALVSMAQYFRRFWAHVN